MAAVRPAPGQRPHVGGRLGRRGTGGECGRPLPDPDARSTRGSKPAHLLPCCPARSPAQIWATEVAAPRARRPARPRHALGAGAGQTSEGSSAAEDALVRLCEVRAGGFCGCVASTPAARPRPGGRFHPSRRRPYFERRGAARASFAAGRRGRAGPAWRGGRRPDLARLEWEQARQRLCFSLRRRLYVKRHVLTRAGAPPRRGRRTAPRCRTRAITAPIVAPVGGCGAARRGLTAKTRSGVLWCTAVENGSASSRAARGPRLQLDDVDNDGRGVLVRIMAGAAGGGVARRQWTSCWSGGGRWASTARDAGGACLTLCDCSPELGGLNCDRTAPMPRPPRPAENGRPPAGFPRSRPQTTYF
jgi:hypothetical protein